VAQQTVPKSASRYPGEDLGLPESGPGSVASMGRRFAALVLDWLLCTLIAYGLFRSRYLTIVVFAFEDYLGTVLGGFTIGKRLVGIRVVRVLRRGESVGWRWAAVRTLLLLCVVPALFTDRDLRGLHDRASDTVVVRL
jgi:uncharacterized RDD family membrane protein YckC